MKVASIRAAVAAQSKIVQQEPTPAKVQQVPPPTAGKDDIAKAVKQLPKPEGKTVSPEFAKSEKTKQEMIKAAIKVPGELSPEKLKGMSAQELTANQMPKLDRAQAQAERAREAVDMGSDELNFKAYTAAANDALTLVGNAMHNAQEWKRAHPGAEVPAALQYSISNAKEAVKSIPKFDSLVGTVDGSTQYMFVSWPNWAL